MALEVKKFETEGLILVQSKVFFDERGYFQELYKTSEIKEAGIQDNFVQDNFSYSKKNVLRGLHYQISPKPQAKLVRVLEGKILDVAVDIRQNSETFKQWVSIELSEGDGKAFYIPAGFAHGFMVLSESARVLYKTSAEYDPNLEKGIKYNDPELNIIWPVKNPIVSEKDLKLPNLASAQIF
jgi:dTDP-4-dehydrorhamnose 3,5-epimerase